MNLKFKSIYKSLIIRLLSVILLFSFTQSCNSPKDKAGRFFVRANEALNERQPEKAINFYSEALAIDTGFVEAYNNRGIAYDRRKEYKEAIRDFSKAIALDSNFLPAYFNRAESNFDLGLYNQTLADLSFLEQYWEDSAKVPLLKGVACFQMADHKRALENFEKAAKLNPENPEIYTNMAIVNLWLDKPEAGIEMAKKALDLEKDMSAAYDVLGMLYAINEDIRAFDAFEKAIDDEPYNTNYLNNQAYGYLLFDSLEDASRLIRKSLAIDKRNLPATFNKAILLYKQGSEESSVQLLDSIAAIDSTLFGFSKWRAKM